MSSELVVNKYILAEGLTHETPMGAKPLYVAFQKAFDPSRTRFRHLGEDEWQLCVWMLCDPHIRKLSRSFIVAGTGWLMPELITRATYAGSAMHPSNGTTWHVFDLGYTNALRPYEQAGVKALEAIHEPSEASGEENNCDQEEGA